MDTLQSNYMDSQSQPGFAAVNPAKYPSDALPAPSCNLNFQHTADSCSYYQNSSGSLPSWYDRNSYQSLESHSEAHGQNDALASNDKGGRSGEDVNLVKTKIHEKFRSDCSDPKTRINSDQDMPADGAKEGTLESCGREKSVDDGVVDGASKPKLLLSENGLTNTHSGTDRDCSAGEEETTSPRKRRSRWDPPPTESNDGSGTGRKRKSRWADDDPKPVIQLPNFDKDFACGIEFDHEIQALNCRLLEISRKLQSGMPLDDRPEGARSPSPEPVYDNMGIRINTREYRAREKLNRERQEIIFQILKKNPAFKPPADYRPPKLQKKLYIPMKEYPGYNFIGLIIGPRGNTQKRMEKESGAKIVIRGKGSIKDGKLPQKRDLKPDPSENEDLHVLVEAETQESLDSATSMIERLLQPVDEVLNEHKRQQLRELAALNGTIRDEEFCRLCGEPGHRQYACTSRSTTFKVDLNCKICGDGGHPTIDCPMKGTANNKMDDEYQNFLAELGGTGPESLVKNSSGTLAIESSGNSGSNSPWASGSNGGVTTQAVGGLKLIKPKENDESNLYIGYLPPTFDDDALISLFSTFGEIVMAKVIKDRVTGLSKGYGFVKYADVQQANSTIASMNGHLLEGRKIAVRVAGRPPQPTLPPGPPVPNVYPSQPYAAGGTTVTAPPGGYGIASVPWAPPASYPPYAAYPPPLMTSAAYTPVPGQPGTSYGVQYSPLTPTSSADPPALTVNSSEALENYSSSSEAQPSYPPLPSASYTPVQSVPTYAYGNSVATMPPAAQPAYSLHSYTYPPCYSLAPPTPAVSQAPIDHSRSIGSVPWASLSQAPVDHSHSIGNVPWVSNTQVPPSASPTQKTIGGTDAEYEKLMSEIK